MADLGAEALCIICNESSSRFCGRCKSARYCSRACQHADWPTHKLLCAAFSNFDVARRPSKDHLRAILFPADKEKPEVIWLHCEWRNDDDDHPFQFADTEPILGADAFGSEFIVQYNTVLKRKISNAIRVCYRDAFLIDGSRRNKSFATIAATQPGEYHDWRGPIITYGREGPDLEEPACRDLDMNDFRHITDHLLTYGREPAPATQQAAVEKIKGVMINCLGDQKVLNKPKFEAVEIPSVDPIFSSSGHDVSDIARRIGLPIFTRRCPPDPKWAKDEKSKLFKGMSPLNNQDATFLHLCCDPEAEHNLRTGIWGWGWVSEQWQYGAGSVLVVREDRKPLFPLHAEALCRYCRNEIRPLFAHSMGEYAPEKPMEKDAVVAMICRPTFVISWYRLLEEKGKEGEDTDAPYPYYDVDFEA